MSAGDCRSLSPQGFRGVRPAASLKLVGRSPRASASLARGFRGVRPAASLKRRSKLGGGFHSTPGFRGVRPAASLKQRIRQAD